MAQADIVKAWPPYATKNILLNAIMVNDFSLFIHQLRIEIVGKCVQSSVEKTFSLKKLMIWFIASHTSAKLIVIEKTSLQKIHGLHESGG